MATKFLPIDVKIGLDLKEELYALASDPEIEHVVPNGTVCRAYILHKIPGISRDLIGRLRSAVKVKTIEITILWQPPFNYFYWHTDKEALHNRDPLSKWDPKRHNHRHSLAVWNLAPNFDNVVPTNYTGIDCVYEEDQGMWISTQEMHMVQNGPDPRAFLQYGYPGPIENWIDVFTRDVL